MTLQQAAKTSVPAWPRELAATLRLAWPLILAQIAQIAFFTTDVVFMSRLGPAYLAASTLATALIHPLFVGCFGLLSATAPMVAQAIGARNLRSVRRTVRQGFWIALLVCVPVMLFLANAAHVLPLLGQEPETAANAALFIRFALWSMPPAMLYQVLRMFISAKNDSEVVLAITATAVLLNVFFNWVLVFGNLGFPALGLIGSGLSTTLSNLLMFAAALAYATRHRRYRRHMILVRFWRPDWPRFFEFFRIGLPIGLTVLSEVGLFAVAVIMMGWLGENEVAGHAVAIQITAIGFMVPLGLSQATTIRVGRYFGAGDVRAAGLSGWTSLGTTLVFMSLTCMSLLLFPHQLAGLFLDRTRPEDLVPIRLAVSYLGVAALFQLVDGTQVSMAGALRGFSDTRVPMIVALIGYWLVGLGTAYYCGFVLDLRGVGIWLGLAAGLAFVAIVLLIRWAMRERLGLTRLPPSLRRGANA